MVKIFFEGSESLKNELKKGLGAGYFFEDDLSSVENVLVEIERVADIHKLKLFQGKKIFPIIKNPEKELIKLILSHKVSGIFTIPLNIGSIITKLGAKNFNTDDIIDVETVKAKILAKAETIPPLPEVARQLIILTSNQKSNFNAITEKVKSDQSIAGKVLKIVNSPFYGLRNEIDSIERASVLIGLSAIKNIAISLSTADYFKKNYALYGKTGRELWNHSFVTALICEEMGKLSTDFNPEALYLAGLMHDFGKIVLVDFILKQVSSTEDEKDQTGFDHTEVAEFILKKWNISKEIIDWIKNHHNQRVAVGASGILYHCNILEKIICSPQTALDTDFVSEVQALSKILERPDEKIKNVLKNVIELQRSGLLNDFS